MAAHSSILAWSIPWTEEPGLENSMDREALASYIVHGFAKRLNTFILVTGGMGGKYLAKQGMGIKMKKSKSE